MNSVFRYHSFNNIPINAKKRRLIKRRSKDEHKHIFMAADRNFIRDAKGCRPIEFYSELPEACYVTLTRKEADLIALSNPGKRPPFPLELLHPWLPQQSYIENVDKNYESLQKIVKKFGCHFITPSKYCDEKWNSVCNAIRCKTDMDARFHSAWHLPVQDCYVLEQNRSDREVIAVDFNSMYPSCMQYKFPKPSELRHVIYNRKVVTRETLPIGLYRCKLSHPKTEFISKYNPLRTFFDGRYLRPTLTEDLLIDLHEFEIDFYHRHFDEVFISDAVVSDRSIDHPLAREARRLFARRAHYIKNNNKPLAEREKFLSTLLASCTHRPCHLDQEFETYTSAKKFLKDIFGIISGAENPAGLSAAWLRGEKNVSVLKKETGLHCKAPNPNSNKACFMFNQRIVARSRVIMLEMMDRILQIAPDMELCYANIDSIHFSFPSKWKNTILKELNSGVSNNMGGYKIEAIANCGLWLEPGRYWLYSDSIKKFRNRSINRSHEVFNECAAYYLHKKINEIYIPHKIKMSIARSMSDGFGIMYDSSTGLDRLKLTEVNSESPIDVLCQLEQNRKLSIPRRYQAYKNLKSLFEGAGTRCLVTQHNCKN